MAIRVRSLAGSLCSLHASTGDDLPVTKLKQMIQRRTGIAPQHQRLIVEASPLWDQQVLHVREGGVDISVLKRSKESADWLTQVEKSRQGKRLATAPQEVRSDPEIAFAAMKWDVADLKHMDDGLFEDRSFMLEAVSTRPGALVFAAPKLKEDADVVLRAARKDPTTLKHAAPELQKCIWHDKEFAIAAFHKNPSVFTELPREHLACPDFVLKAVKKVPSIIARVGTTHRANRDIVLAAVSQDGALLRFASDSLREDPELIRASTKHSKRPSTAGIRL